MVLDQESKSKCPSASISDRCWADCCAIDLAQGLTGATCEGYYKLHVPDGFGFVCFLIGRFTCLSKDKMGKNDLGEGRSLHRTMCVWQIALIEG